MIIKKTNPRYVRLYAGNGGLSTLMGCRKQAAVFPGSHGELLLERECMNLNGYPSSAHLSLGTGDPTQAGAPDLTELKFQSNVRMAGR